MYPPGPSYSSDLSDRQYGLAALILLHHARICVYTSLHEQPRRYCTRIYVRICLCRSKHIRLQASENVTSHTLTLDLGSCFSADVDVKIATSAASLWGVSLYVFWLVHTKPAQQHSKRIALAHAKLCARAEPKPSPVNPMNRRCVHCVPTVRKVWFGF